MCLVVPVLPGPVAVDVGVDASPRRKRHLGHQANNFKSPLLATLPRKERSPYYSTDPQNGMVHLEQDKIKLGVANDAG